MTVEIGEADDDHGQDQDGDVVGHCWASEWSEDLWRKRARRAKKRGKYSVSRRRGQSRSEGATGGCATMDRSVMRRLRGSVLSVLAAGMAGCGPPALVSDARPEATIVVSPTARGDESLAATELRDYVAKISGAHLAIQSSLPKEGPVVRIGVYGSEPVREWAGRAPPPDGYALRTTGQELWIVGGDVRGALYGVYDLLETDLGVRWFMPGELGEDVPSRKDIPMPKVDREGAPASLRGRRVHLGGRPRARTSGRSARARPGGTELGVLRPQLVQHHPRDRETKAAHPEWFALSGGARTNQLCSAHPDVVRITVEKARAFFDRNPSRPRLFHQPERRLRVLRGLALPGGGPALRRDRRQPFRSARALRERGPGRAGQDPPGQAGRHPRLRDRTRTLPARPGPIRTTSRSSRACPGSSATPTPWTTRPAT